MVYRLVFIDFNLSWFILGKIIELFFFIDIIINSLSTYQNEEGVYCNDYSKIRSRYLKSWFTIDFLTIIPFDIIEYYF